MTKLAKSLIGLALLVLPFVFWPGIDVFRTPKEAAALSLSLFIVCLIIYSGKLIQFRNKWILLFVLYSLLCAYFSPKFGQFRLAYFSDRATFQILLQQNIMNFWQWKIVAQVIIFALLAWSISSLRFRRREIISLFYAMAIAGLLMSLYVFLQALGIDPLFVIDNRNTDVAALSRPALGGVIGHSTLAAVFIGMTVPFAVYFKRWGWLIISLAALLLLDSQIAQGALLLTGLGWLALSSMKGRIFAAFLIGLLITGAFWFAESNPGKTKELLNDSGRSSVWSNIITDLKTPPLQAFGDQRKYALTGLGPGAFEYVYPNAHETRWTSAHNEYLETAYNFGLIGLFLLVMIGVSIIAPLKNSPNIPLIYPLIASIGYVSLTALGTFPWHIEPMRFYTVVIVGLLLNKQILEEKLI